MSFSTYGLIDPRTGKVFYVGQTNSLKKRMAQHNSGTLGKDIRAAGLQLSFCIFGEFLDRLAALRLERALILMLPGLVNPKAGNMLSENLYPVGEEDCWLLTEAIRPMPSAVSYVSLVNEKRSIAHRGPDSSKLRGRPKTITDMKAYKRDKAKQYRAAKQKPFHSLSRNEDTSAVRPEDDK